MHATVELTIVDLKKVQESMVSCETPAKIRRYGFRRMVNARNHPQPEIKTEPIEENLQDAPNEDEGDIEDIVDLLGSDDEDQHYKQIDGAMICIVCDKKFTVVKQFKAHDLRHSSLDHYQCPTCLQGFTTLTNCILHENKMHKKNDASTAVEGTVNPNDIEEDGKRILPSNSLQCYRGPPVKHLYNAFDVERKHGLKATRKGNLFMQIEKMRNDNLYDINNR